MPELKNLDCHNCESENVTEHSASINDISDAKVLVCNDCLHVHMMVCRGCNEYLSKASVEKVMCENCNEFVY